MIDTHCHLTHGQLAVEATHVIGRAWEAGLGAVITIGTGVEDARRCLDLTEAHPGFVFATAGIDPFTAHRVGDRFDDEFAALREALETGRYVALGEVGLDYHYDLDPKAVQADRFHRQLALAAELDLPVVVHVRDAHDDAAAVLAEHPGNRGVIHSFTAGPAEATRYLELGWVLGLNGVVTFKNAPEVREAAAMAPPDRIVLETDSPYLAPVPFRGRRCEPAYVSHTLRRLAEVRGESIDTVDAVTDANARRLFALPER